MVLLIVAGWLCMSNGRADWAWNHGTTMRRSQHCPYQNTHILRFSHTVRLWNNNWIGRKDCYLSIPMSILKSDETRERCYKSKDLVSSWNLMVCPITVHYCSKILPKNHSSPVGLCSTVGSVLSMRSHHRHDYWHIRTERTSVERRPLLP